MASSDAGHGGIEYCPVSRDLVQQYAFSVCQQLGTGFDDREVVLGFADFLQVVSQICANNLNRGCGGDVGD